MIDPRSLWTPEWAEVFRVKPWEMWDLHGTELRQMSKYLAERRKAIAEARSG